MKRVRMVGVVVVAVLLAMAFARPMEASPQVRTAGTAAELEAGRTLPQSLPTAD